MKPTFKQKSYLYRLYLRIGKDPGEIASMTKDQADYAIQECKFLIQHADFYTKDMGDPFATE